MLEKGHEGPTNILTTARGWGYLKYSMIDNNIRGKFENYVRNGDWGTLVRSTRKNTFFSQSDTLINFSKRLNQKFCFWKRKWSILN